MALTYREVQGYFTARIPDSGDADLNPDTVPLTGNVTFRPEYRKPLVFPGEHIVLESINAIIIDGQLMVEVVQDEDVVLQALHLPVTIDERGNQSWSWTMRFQNITLGDYGEEVSLPDRRFPIEPGSEPLDLSSVAGQWSGGGLITRGAPGPGLQEIVAVDGEIVFAWDNGRTTTIEVPDAIPGPPGDDGVGIAQTLTGDGGTISLSDGGGSVTIPTATTSEPGLLTAEDKQRIDNSASAAYVDSAIDDARVVLNGEGAPTESVKDGAVYVDTSTGEQWIGVDRGPGPVTNMATNPSFESAGINLGTTYAATTPTFRVAAINFLYQQLEDGSTPAERRWVNRKPHIVDFIESENLPLVSVQENSITPSGSSIQEVVADLPDRFGYIEVNGSNNGAIYDTEVFELEELVSDSLEINRKFLSSGIQRTLTIARFRHIEADLRLIFGVVHFNQGNDAHTVASRAESVDMCVRYLDEYAGQFRDYPGIIISGDFNASDSVYDRFEALGFEASKNKAETIAFGDQGTWHGFSVDGNSSGNWIDDNYSNVALRAVDSRPWIKFAIGNDFPMSTEFLSDHHPVVTEFQFQCSKNVALNNSTSAATTGGSASHYYSTSWALRGGGSVAIKGNGATSSALYPAGQNGGMGRLRWEAGKTYTVSAFVRLREPLESPSTMGRRISVGVAQGGGAFNFSWAIGPLASNVAGVHRTSMTFTLPADTTDAHIRLLNGSATSTIWWGCLMITEGDVDHEYFDGDTLGCFWAGVPHGSASVYPGPSWVRLGRR